MLIYRAESLPTSSPAQSLPEYMLGDPYIQGMISASGRWYTDDYSEAEWYLTNEYPNGDGHIVCMDIPAEDVETYRVSNLPESHSARTFSRRPDKELFLPAALITSRKEPAADSPEPEYDPREDADSEVGGYYPDLSAAPGSSRYGAVSPRKVYFTSPWYRSAVASTVLPED